MTIAAPAAAAIAVAVSTTTTLVTGAVLLLAIVRPVGAVVGPIGPALGFALGKAFGRFGHGLGRRRVRFSVGDPGFRGALEKRDGRDADESVIEEADGPKETLGEDVQRTQNVGDHDQDADKRTLLYESGQSVGKAAKF